MVEQRPTVLLDHESGHNQKGNNAGKTYERRCSGYTATFAGAVDTFIECKIRESKIESFTELKKTISNIKKEVRNWKCAVERG